MKRKTNRQKSPARATQPFPQRAGKITEKPATDSHSAAAGETQPQVRRDHKDTLFRMLFRSKENLLSLYNAVNGTAYTDSTELEIVTLENAVYMNMKNDQAFLLDFQLNLYEHQSTWSPNMPLRDLFYVSREYQNLVRTKTLYASRLVKIPTPHFIVFYNGTEFQGESCILKLSDAFEKPTAEPELELIVKVLNIGKEKNQALMDGCQLLWEYMLFVEQVREYAATMDPNQAVGCAVEECIKKGILAEFLSRNRGEAIAVSIFEYDEVREKELMRKAEYAEGYDAGHSSGVQEGYDAGHSSGVREGYSTGHSSGLREGEQRTLKTLISKKLAKKKTPAEIADELEIEVSDVIKLTETLRKEGDAAYRA